jgi:HSP20 family protein
MSEFDRLRNEINRLFDFDAWPEATGLFDRSFSPSLDVAETDDNFVVSVDLPGVPEKDIDITVANNVLTIRGEKKSEKEEKGTYYRKETWSGSFQRTISLPSTVDADQVEANMKNGVLEVSLPKREEAKPKRISVNVK